MSAVAAFPTAGGAMGAAIRARDWADSPLGPIAAWRAPLRAGVDMLVAR